MLHRIDPELGVENTGPAHATRLRNFAYFGLLEATENRGRTYRGPHLTETVWRAGVGGVL